MSGFKVLEALREEWDSRELPIIMLTSTPPLLGEQTALNFGVSHYLTKPWSVGTVETVVRVALREAKVARGEGDDFSDYLKPKKKENEPPKAQPDGTLPAVIDDRGRSADEKMSATTSLAEPEDDLGDDDDDDA